MSCIYMAFAPRTDIIGISSMMIPLPFGSFATRGGERAKWELYVDSTLHTCLLNEERMDTPNCHGQNALGQPPEATVGGPAAPCYIEFSSDAGNRLFIVVYDQSERAIFTQH